MVSFMVLLLSSLKLFVHVILKLKVLFFQIAAVGEWQTSLCSNVAIYLEVVLPSEEVMSQLF